MTVGRINSISHSLTELNRIARDSPLGASGVHLFSRLNDEKLHSFACHHVSRTLRQGDDRLFRHVRRHHDDESGSLWSEKGIMMMPYVKAFGAATTLPGFFARMTGLGFIILVLGKHFGASDKTFSQQAGLSRAEHQVVLRPRHDDGWQTPTGDVHAVGVEAPSSRQHYAYGLGRAIPRRREVGHQEGLSRYAFSETRTVELRSELLSH